VGPMTDMYTHFIKARCYCGGKWRNPSVKKIAKAAETYHN